MRLSERLFLLSVIFYGVILCVSNKTKERKGRHFLMLLGYLHGYKIGQDYALKLPSLLSPVIFLPSVNQQQTVNFQNGITDENYQEIGDVTQLITSAKLTSNESKETGQNDDIKITFHEFSGKLEDNTKQCNETENRQEAVVESTPININKEHAITEHIRKNVIKVQSDSTLSNLNTQITQPPYNNEIINSLTIPTTPRKDLALPPASDIRWQNFTLRANPSDLVDGNMTLIDDLQNNTLSPSSTEIVTEYPVETTITFSNGAYPNALYNNEVIDQLSITTNSYTNQESPFPHQDDRWSPLHTMNKAPKTDGFKPLAGLYYDGFLHRPLKKFPFTSHNYIR